VEFKKLLNQGWRKRSNVRQLIKNLIMLLLIIYILLQLKGL